MRTMIAARVVTLILAMAAATAAAENRAQAVTITGQVVPLDTVAEARTLARAGRYAAAVALLEPHLAASPGDTDARVLLGTVLSWAGEYDAARRHLESVLDENPTHGDALPALINVELWSNRPERAEALSAVLLRDRPDDSSGLLARARALSALRRPAEARDVLDHLLAVDPRNEQARAFRRSVHASLQRWQAAVDVGSDWFSQDRVAWRELQASLKRTTAIGAVVARGAVARRFGVDDEQFEIEAYPTFRPGTYMYVAGAFSVDGRLYPVYRYAVDLFQRLGTGLEGSLGYRRLGFGGGGGIYVASLSKYRGPWLFTGRAFLVPDRAGRAQSIHGSVRRYFSDQIGYIGVRYGQGATREEIRNLNDFEVLDSRVVGGEVNVPVGDAFEFGARGTYSREDRPFGRRLRQYSAATTFAVRF